jgi:hypothetical protein
MDVINLLLSETITSQNHDNHALRSGDRRNFTACITQGTVVEADSVWVDHSLPHRDS